MERKNIILKVFRVLIVLASVFCGVLDAQEDEKSYCFESAHVFSDKEYVQKVVLYLDEVNASIRMFYTLANERTYLVEDLFCNYNKERNIYSCGIECDGGELEFDVKNQILKIDELRASGCADILPPLFLRNKNFIEPLVNPLQVQGILNTKQWILGKRCKLEKELKVKRVYYVVSEYEKVTSKRQDTANAFKSFYAPMIEKDEDTSKMEIIKLKKPYSNIAQMMREEGFSFDWLNIEDIELFVYDNNRAFIHIVPDIPENISGCFCTGYYLLELQDSILRKRSILWECGSVVVPVLFKPEPVIVEHPIVVEKNDK